MAASRSVLVLFLATLTCVMTACSEPPKFNSTDISMVDWGKDFQLTDHTGKPAGLADYRGKAVVLFFGYTQCPDVCPTTLSTMKMALSLMGEDAKRVQVVFVTLDPAHDTPALLAQYVPAFHPSFVGLTGDEAAIAAVAKNFRVFFVKQAAKTGTSYSIDHSTGSYAFDPQGRLRLLIRHGETPDRIASDLKLLLASK